MRPKLETSLATIAAEAGVSISTVSRVLNNRGRISEATRRRIQELLRSHDFFFRRGSRNVLLVMSDILGDMGCYDLRVLSAIRCEALRRGYGLEMVGCDDLSMVSDHDFLGVLSMDIRQDLSLKWRRISNSPLVCINDSGNPLTGIPSVYSDEKSSVPRAIEHLVGYNHRRIGLLLWGEDNFCSRFRKETFLEGMASHGLSGSAFVVSYASEPLGAIDTLLKSGVTAIIIPSETMSIQTLHCLRTLGRRVPEDLSLVAWEYRGVSEFLDPPLTALEQDFETMALCAFETLEKLANGLKVQLQQKIAYKLFKRESVALPPSRRQ